MTFPVINVKLAPAIVPLGCVENEQVEAIPIEVWHEMVLEFYGDEAIAGEVIEQVYRIRVAVLNVQYTDLIRSECLVAGIRTFKEPGHKFIVC